MNFFEIGPRQDFASYSVETPVGEVADQRIIPPYRGIAGHLKEYLGDPPRRPGKQGDFHASAHGVFLRASAAKIFESAARGKLLAHPVAIAGRELEAFRQLWVTNFVDCLDLAKTSASPSSGFYKGKIGVIKRAVFDEQRWDGSDLFVVPQDPSFSLFCTETFVKEWKAARLKGIMFSRFLMDPDPILS